jgi:hypothetical protein
MENHKTSIPVLITRLEASKKLRCSLTTLDRLGIEFVKIRRRIYYREETITAWILTQETSSRRHS